MIGADQLRALNSNVPSERAQLYAKVLDAAAATAQLYTPRRVRHFIAQVMVETGGLRSLVESTDYKDPVRLDTIFKNVQGVDHARRLIAQGRVAIGNTIYANKNGNGDIASGDGFRFRGRGFLQVTGRGNYRRIGGIAKLPLEDQPELLGEPAPAADAAARYWIDRKINDAADADDLGTVTLLVNGPARLHLKERGEWLKAAARIWAG